MSRCSLPWFLLPLRLYSKSFWSSEVSMQSLTILSMICAPQLISYVPFLIMLGYLAKHYTRFPNRYLPLMETVVGAVIGVLYGVCSSLNGDLNMVSAVTMYGSQGVVLGFSSISIYDCLYNALFKTPQEVRGMKETKERKKWNPMDSNWFVYGISVIASVAMCAVIELIFHGAGSVLPFIRDYAYLCVIPCVVVDCMSKVSKEKAFITWQYLVMMGMIISTCVLYAWMSTTTTWVALRWFAVGIATVIAGTVVWYNKMYLPALAKKKVEVIESIHNDLIEKGADGKSAKIAVDYFFGEEE